MIEFQSETKLFHLKTERFSYVMQVLADGRLGHRYFGKRINHFSSSHHIVYQDRAFSGNPTAKDRTYSLDTLAHEYSSIGLGDFRSPSIELASAAGTTLDLKYRGHELTPGKPSLQGLPASYGTADQVETLTIELYDALMDVTVYLRYSVFSAANYLTRSVEVVAGRQAVNVETLLSFTLDMPHKNYHVHTLTGRYAYEKEWTVTPLTQGRYEIGSVRGASSHSRTPFIALASPDATENGGEIYSSHLVYSGNFKAFAETTAIHTTRWGMGLNDEQFSWLLAPGERLQSPEALLSYTDGGWTEMTHCSHDFIRQHLMRGRFINEERPILINNWEATYFHFTEDKIVELAKEAAQSGIELFVLDDGWFGQRDTDTCSLGDWVENREKLPNGLKGLAQAINDLGMQFGLWFEPEMISEESELYRAHPDWAIQTTGRHHTYSREQLVLDLSKPEVQDYIIQAVSGILKSANISYVKWDMNRNITNPPEQLSNHERKEFHHRYMLGLYRVLEVLTQTFPDVLFESCSGGGGRNDLGLLYYMPQAWASDNTDAIGRLSIQEGTTLIYPSISMGAHVSAIPNHQVGRYTPFETRGNVAMMGNFGFELDLNALPDRKRAQVTEQVATYKRIRQTVQFGQLYRLQKTANTYAQIYVNRHQTQAVMTFVKILAQPEAPFIQVKLKGLNPRARYRCEQLAAEFYGDELMHIGLTLPYVQKDFFSVQYIFNQV